MRIAISLVLALAVICGQVQAEFAKEDAKMAVKAFKKYRAKVSVGLPLKDLKLAYADLDGETSDFCEITPKDISMLSIRKALRSASAMYLFALRNLETVENAASDTNRRSAQKLLDECLNGAGRYLDYATLLLTLPEDDPRVKASAKEIVKAGGSL
jgi:hypothetical protein